MSPTDPDRISGADVGWLLLAFVAAVLVAAQLTATGIGLAFGPRRMATVHGLGGALAAWWFAKGAWLRTCWGRPTPIAAPPWQEPVLTERRAYWYLWLGAACVVAASIALGLQARHWVG